MKGLTMNIYYKFTIVLFSLFLSSSLAFASAKSDSMEEKVEQFKSLLREKFKVDPKTVGIEYEEEDDSLSIEDAHFENNKALLPIAQILVPQNISKIELFDIYALSTRVGISDNPKSIGTLKERLEKEKAELLKLKKDLAMIEIFQAKEKIDLYIELLKKMPK